MSPSEKQHHTDRYRGGHQWVEKWTNSKAFLIGFLTGRGYSSTAIAETLADGTSDESIRDMWKKWGREAVRRRVSLTIDLSTKERASIFKRAAQHQISPEEYVRRLIVSASMPRDRFDEICGEQHEAG